MRLFIACALVLATIAAVQSNPISSQLGNLDDVHNAFPQYSELINQLINVAGQIASYVPNEKLESLTARAIQLATDVFERGVDVNAAITELLQRVKEALGPNSPIRGDLETLAQEVKAAILAIFPHLASTSGKRSAAVARTDLSALINQVQINDLIAAFPQYSDLINQLISIAAQVDYALSQTQSDALRDQAMQLAQNVFNGNMDINLAINQLFQQVQQYLGPNSPILSNVQSLIPQLLNAVGSVFPNSLPASGKRSAAVARTDLSALINQVQINDLIAAFPQYSDLINQLISIAAQVDYALSQTQSDALRDQAMQLAQNVFNGNMDINLAINQLFQQVQQYLGPNSPILSNVQSLIPQLLNAVGSVFPNSA